MAAGNESRNILDADGNVIGMLILPEGTSEEIWAEKLALYTVAPRNIQDVTPRQIRQALVLQGISLADIDSALNSLEEPTKSLALISWEFSLSFERSNPLVAQVGQMLGWNDSQLDDLWIFAGSL